MSIGALRRLLDDQVSLINLSRDGLPFDLFDSIVQATSFSIKEWSSFIHLTERTLQRYRKEQRTFESVQTDRILEIAILQEKGLKLFDCQEALNQWLNAHLVALGGQKPKDLLDSTFGITMVKDLMGRIEHGVLA